MLSSNNALLVDKLLLILTGCIIIEHVAGNAWFILLCGEDLKTILFVFGLSL